MKKNIALFVGKLTGGGAERAVSRLSIALSEYYNVYILVYNTRRIDYDYKGQLIDIANDASCFPFMAIKAAININSVVKKYNIDLVISFLDMPNMINGIFNRSCKKITSIRAYHEKGHLFTLADKIKYPFLEAAFKKSDCVMTLSKQQKEILIKNMRIVAENIVVVNNIYDSKEILEKAAEVPSDSEIFNFIDEYTTVAVGRLNFQKNYKALIDLFSNLIEIQDNAKLLILGEGEQRDYLQDSFQRLIFEDSLSALPHLK